MDWLYALPLKRTATPSLRSTGSHAKRHIAVWIVAVLRLDNIGRREQDHDVREDTVVRNHGDAGLAGARTVL